MTTFQEGDEEVQAAHKIRSDTPKRSTHWWLVVAVLAAWLAVFWFATAQCSLADVATLSCSITWPPPSTAITNIAEKAQLGDTFGTVNGLFGAVTLYLVYRTYHHERSSAEHQLAIATDELNLARQTSQEQMRFIRRERYYAEVAASIESYNGLLREVNAPDWKGGVLVATWQGRDALWHWWKRRVLETGHAENWGATRASILAKASPEIWLPIFRLIRDEENGMTTSKDIVNLFLTHKGSADALVQKVASAWQRLYAIHQYQLDALFRSWFHVCKTIESAESLDVDAETEWAVASRFRAQMSSIELTYLLANQVFSEGAEGDGYPQARRYCERYAIFDNYKPGIDPAAVVCISATGHGQSGIVEIRRAFEDKAFSSDEARKTFRRRSPVHGASANV